MDDLNVSPNIAEINLGIVRRYPALDDARRGAELVRELISYLINSVAMEAGRRLNTAKPNSVDDVRKHHDTLVAFSADAAEVETTIKAFLKQRMYRHTRVMNVMNDAESWVRDLFARYHASPRDLPADWSAGEGDDDETSRARRIGDFIAGMTDRYAIVEHARLFDSTPELR